MATSYAAVAAGELPLDDEAAPEAHSAPETQAGTVSEAGSTDLADATAIDPVAEIDPDPVLLAAREQARAALTEITDAQTIGSEAGYEVHEAHVITLFFESRMAGYPGWRWAATLARVDENSPVNVLEVELLPGADAVVAPDWVPWSERLAQYRDTKASRAAENLNAALDEAADSHDEDLDDEDDLLDNDFSDFDADIDGVDIDELDDDSDDDDSDDEDLADEDRADEDRADESDATELFADDSDDADDDDDVDDDDGDDSADENHPQGKLDNSRGDSKK